MCPQIALFGLQVTSALVSNQGISRPFINCVLLHLYPVTKRFTSGATSAQYLYYLQAVQTNDIQIQGQKRRFGEAQTEDLAYCNLSID